MKRGWGVLDIELSEPPNRIERTGFCEYEFRVLRFFSRIAAALATG
jgi:hypothetical protein